jgi:hypothetical protein
MASESKSSGVDSSVGLFAMVAPQSPLQRLYMAGAPENKVSGSKFR